MRLSFGKYKYINEIFAMLFARAPGGFARGFHGPGHRAGSCPGWGAAQEAHAYNRMFK